MDPIPTIDDDGELTTRPPELPLDVDRIRSIVEVGGVGLVIIDVLMAFLSPRVNSWSDQHIRRALLPLAAMAEATDCSILSLRHLAKSPHGNALYRGGGSIGIIGAARAGLQIYPNPRAEGEPGKYVLLRAKENLTARDGTSLTYEVFNDPMWHTARIRWTGRSDITLEECMAAGLKRRNDTATIDAAVEWLREYLSEGAVDFRELRRAGVQEGHHERTLQRAASKVPVTIRRVGSGKHHKSTWALAEGPS